MAWYNDIHHTIKGPVLPAGAAQQYVSFARQYVDLIHQPPMPINKKKDTTTGDNGPDTIRK